MILRRSLFAFAGSLFLSPKILFAAEPNQKALPSCLITKDVGGWGVTSSVDVDEDGSVKSSLVLKSYPANGHFAFGDIEFRKSTPGRLSFSWGDQNAVLVTLPRGYLPDATYVSDGFFASQPGKISFVVDGQVAHTSPAGGEHKFKFEPNSELFDRVKNGKLIKVSFMIRDQVVSSFEVSLSGYSNALELGEEQASHLEKEVSSAGGCEVLSGPVPTGGCIMTTAAVDMLGRKDDCFELTQMRRLRSQYPEERDTLQDYLNTGERLLRHAPDVRFKVLLFVFYLLVVWPTAVSAYLGKMGLAKSIYLSGFFVFKRVSNIFW